MYKHCPAIAAVVGFTVLILGILCTWYVFPTVVQNQIEKNIIMREGSQAFSTWTKQPFPLLFKVYFFQVENPAEIMLGEKPKLREKGPYIYDLFMERKVLDIDEEEDTIKYRLTKRFQFNAEASGCHSDEDIVTIINAPLIGTVNKVYDLFPGLLNLVERGVPYIYPGIKDIFLRVKVKDVLFDGIKLHCTDPEIAFLCNSMRSVKPSTMKIAPNEKDLIFSMLDVYNGTFPGKFLMTRGIKNTTRGTLEAYAGSKDLDIWQEGVCNLVNGSDSGLYFPMKKPADKIYTFVPEICRSVAAFFEKPVEQNGLKAFRYTSTEETLSSEGPYKCFCQEDCPPKGLLDLEPCHTAPVYLSNPHFYLGDKSLLENVQGLKPSREKHESYLVLEPKTATPLEGAKRSQMNIKLRSIDNFTMLENVSDTVFPILWIEEGVQLPEELLAILSDGFKAIGILDVLKWAVIALGLLLMLTSFVLLMYRERLMCFATDGNVTITEPHQIFTTSTSQLPLNFNTKTVYPKCDNLAFEKGEENGDRKTGDAGRFM